MKDRGWSLFRKGLKRRRREVLRLRFMMGFAVFLTAFVLLFQDNINAYVMQNNYRSYGRWVFRTEEGARVESPYLDWERVRVGGYLQKLYDLPPEPDPGGEDGEPAPAEQERGEPADRIEVPENENRRQTSVKIGSMGEAFAAENELGLYEGRFPRTPNEIAMELGALQQLGLSYKLGQEVSFYLAEPAAAPVPTPGASAEGEEPETVLVLSRVSFTLCGTLERYTARWDEGDSLPGALITGEAFDGLSMDKRAFEFGMLKPEYRDHSVWSFASELIDAVRASARGADGALVANEAAYYNPFWGDPELYRNMIAVLLILCVSLVTYLTAAYLTKRKRFFLRLREIGASTAEVWKMAAYECALAVLPALLAGIVGAYALSLAAVFAMTSLGGFPWFYVFLWQTLLRVLLCVLVTFGVSLLAALLIFSGRGISEKRRGLSKRAAAALRHRASKQSLRLGYRESLKRERIRHSLSTALRRLAAVLVCAVLVYSFDEISGAAKAYHAKLTPFSGTRTTAVSLRCRVPTGPTKTENFDLGGSAAPFLRNTIPEAFFAELAEKPGVASFTRILSDRFRAVSWDGKEENEAYRQYLEALAEERVGPYNRENKALPAFLDKIDLSVFLISVRENAEADWKNFGLKGEGPDYDAYLRGEAVVLGSNSDFRERAELKPGDTLYLSGVNGGLSVTVAALTEHNTQGATLFGSAAFGARLQALDGADGQWNTFVTTFDTRSDKENTAKALAELCTRYGLDYMSSAETLKDIEENYLRAGVTYGFFSLSLWILFLFMAAAVSAERDLRLKDKRELLRKLGAEEQAFTREKRREAIREALYGLAALPLALAARYWLIWKELGQAGGASFYSRLLGRNLNYGEAFHEMGRTDSRGLYALIQTLETRSWLWLLIPLLLAVLLTAFAYGKTGKGDDNA